PLSLVARSLETGSALPPTEQPYDCYLQGPAVEPYAAPDEVAHGQCPRGSHRCRTRRAGGARRRSGDRGRRGRAGPCLPPGPGRTRAIELAGRAGPDGCRVADRSATIGFPHRRVLPGSSALATP